MGEILVVDDAPEDRAFCGLFYFIADLPQDVLNLIYSVGILVVGLELIEEPSLCELWVRMSGSGNVGIL